MQLKMTACPTSGRLSFEQIKAITVGAVNIECTDGGIRFFKCTHKQIAAWYRKNEILGNRAEGCTGVRLDFHTDSKRIAFRVIEGGKYEVHVNGLLAAAYKLSSGERAELALLDPIGGELDECRVTLVFPSHDRRGVIDYVELDEGAFVRPHKFDCKMLFIGDSITQGWASSLDSYSYAYRVSSFFNAESVIQGIGGAYFNEESFDILPFDPDVVFVAYGTNDFGHYKAYDELRVHCEAHLGLIAEEYKGKKVFVLSPIWRDQREGKAMGTFEGCRAVIIETAKKLGLIHIDGLILVPPLKSLFADGFLHPNDNGFSLYAENLIKEVQKYI